LPQAALTEPLRRWDPEQIGGYALVGRLGAGAMGQVYLGRSASGRLVAVKTIKIEFADEPGFRTRFAQEVAAARRVSGAFTAAVVAADPEADVPWLATAYVPAPALSTLVRACGPLPVPAVRWLAAGCAEALESIHGAGLVHRDLKPSNVLVSPDGPRVIDFGVARAAERIQLTVTRGAVGTPAYMAPEQARDTRQATMASDVFSLGATMLFAATGHAPYLGETVMDVLVRLATEPPDLTGLPDDLADIVRACLQRDPRKRPNPAAVLAHLAPGIGRADRAREPGPSSLPDPVLALIEEYRRDPRPSALASEEPGEDATFGSQAGSQDPGGERAEGRQARRGHAGAWHHGVARSGRPRRRWAVLAACSAAAVVVLAGAAAAGFAVADSRRPPVPPPPPPNIVVVPPAEASQASAHQAGRPQIALYQRFGDGYTVFVLHGVGWVPGQQVTVALAGLRASPVHPVVDSAGTFSYAINQDHEFFRGPLPPGTYRVVVTAPGRARAVASFVVQRLPGPTSTTGPPGGSTTPGH
jgi:Protein kinase domain